MSTIQLSDHPTAPRQETPRSDPPAPPVKETARSNASDDDDFDAVAGSTISHEAPGISNPQPIMYADTLIIFQI